MSGRYPLLIVGDGLGLNCELACACDLGKFLLIDGDVGRGAGTCFAKVLDFLDKPREPEFLTDEVSLGVLLAFDKGAEELALADFLESLLDGWFLSLSSFSAGVCFTFLAIFENDAFPEVFLGVSALLSDEELMVRRGTF